MRRVRRAGIALVGLVLVASTTSCASETESYCAELEEQKQTLTDLATGSTDPSGNVLEETLEVFRTLREAAPGDIEDEWSTLVFAYEGLADAFGAAGTTPGEFDPGSPPEDVSDAEAERIEGAAAELRSQRVVKAADGLQQHARDVCKVDLGLSSGGG
jgi:hypothetical protein